MKFRHKSALTMFLLGSAFLVALSVVYYVVSQRMAIAQAHGVSLHIAQKTAQHMDLFLREKGQDSLTISNAPVIIDSLVESNASYAPLSQAGRQQRIDAENAQWMAAEDDQAPIVQRAVANDAAEYLRRQQDTISDGYGEIFLTNRYGALVASTGRLTTFAHAHKNWWLQSFNQGKGRTYFDDRGYDESVEGYVLGVVVPVRKNGEIIGILKCNLSIMGSLSEIIHTFQREDIDDLRLARTGGTYVYERGKTPLSTTVPEELAEEIAAWAAGSAVIQTPQGEALVAYAPVPMTKGSDAFGFGGTPKSIDHTGGNPGEGWFIVTSANMDEVLGATAATAWFIVAIGLLFSLGMALGAMFLGARMALPITALTAYANRIGQSDFDARIDIESKDELGALAGSFNTMARDLRDTVISSDRLSEEVAQRTTELIEASDRLRVMQYAVDHTSDSVAMSDQHGKFVYVNEALSRSLGYSSEELLSMGVCDIDTDIPAEAWPDNWASLKEQGFLIAESHHRTKDGRVFPVDVIANYVEFGGKEYNFAYARDITERKRAENDRETSIELLEVLNVKNDLRDLMRTILRFMRELSGCEAVGIRLRDGDDFPYYETSGFSEAFVEAESSLCARDLDGHVERDEFGNPVLECMCGNIIRGRFDPSRPFFTDHGSFVSNGTTEFLANMTAEDRQARTRNRCNREGYESLALIPLRAAGETFGLLQFNDRRKGHFSDQFIALVEYLADSVAIAIGQRRAEERIAASLKEKEVLLREIHHRVKNNMQVIVSLLRMHARRSRSERMRTIFDDCRDRVNAMSLVHEALYQSENLARIDFKAYIEKLCRNLSQAHGASGKGIAVRVEGCDISLGMDQGVAVGMVVCELVSNAFKYAFPKGEAGLVSVSLSSLSDEEIELIVQDDGIGLPQEIDILNSPSLGLELAVAAVTGELGGSIEVERDGGTRFIVRFECKSA